MRDSPSRQVHWIGIARTGLWWFRLPAPGLFPGVPLRLPFGLLLLAFGLFLVEAFLPCARDSMTCLASASAFSRASHRAISPGMYTGV